MLTVLGILTHLIGETLRWIRLAFRSTQSIKAENLFLRRQLALYVERGVNPPRIDPLTRISLAMLSRFFEWRKPRWWCCAPQLFDALINQSIANLAFKGMT